MLFFQATVVSILQSGYTTRTLTKCTGEKLDGNYTGMLQAILNKSWRQQSTKQQLCGYLPPIKKTIQVRGTRHAWHCCRNKDELMSDILQWSPSYGLAQAGRQASIYIQQVCADTRYNVEDIPVAMDDRDGWRVRVREICAGSATRSWWLIWPQNRSKLLWNRCNMIMIYYWDKKHKKDCMS